MAKYKTKREWLNATVSPKHLKKLASKDFTFVSVYGADDGAIDKFVLWVAKPKEEVKSRAEKFIKRVYEKDLEFHSYPRNYVGDAERLVATGVHEDASTEAIKKVFQAYKETRSKIDKLISEREAAEEARKQQEIQAGTHEDMESLRALQRYTGTYIGDETGFPMWRDTRGYVHLAPAWMQKYKAGQKFREGDAVDSLKGKRKKKPSLSRRKNPARTKRSGKRKHPIRRSARRNPIQLQSYVRNPAVLAYAMSATKRKRRRRKFQIAHYHRYLEYYHGRRLGQLSIVRRKLP
jgi:hypothetical protein